MPCKAKLICIIERLDIPNIRTRLVKDEANDNVHDFQYIIAAIAFLNSKSSYDIMRWEKSRFPRFNIRHALPLRPTFRT